MNYHPQQPYPQQPQYAPPPPAAAPGVAPGQAAAANLFNQFLTAPPKQRISRARPADGMNVVRFTPGCKVDYSSKDGQAYVLIEYQVLESTVPQNANQIFGYPMKLVTRNNIESLAEVAKVMFGLAGIQQLQARGVATPQAMADVIVTALKSGNWYGYIETRRSQKQVQTVGYEQAFVNNNFLFFAQQPFTLAQAQQQMTAMQPQGAPAPAPQQQWAPQAPAPQQQQQWAPQAPAPQQQQWAPQAPPPQAPAPQQWAPQAPAPQPSAPLPQPAPQAWQAAPPMHIPQQPPAFPQR